FLSPTMRLIGLMPARRTTYNRSGQMLPYPVSASDKSVKDLFSLLSLGAPGVVIVPAVVFLITHQLYLTMWTFYGLLVCAGASLLVLWIRMGAAPQGAVSSPAAATGSGLEVARLRPSSSLSAMQRTSLAVTAFAAVSAPLFFLIIKSVSLPGSGALIN